MESKAFSNSQIQTFKNCRRLYELKYRYCLEYAEPIECLEQGSQYHECLEHLLKGEEYEAQNPKIQAMAKAFEKYVLPKLPEIADTEKWFDYATPHGNKIIGRYDALSTDGTPIEHKTTSRTLDGEYLLSIERDEQILTYLAASGKTQMYYTVCKKPTIRQTKNESDEEFEHRLEAWYDTDTESKIGIITVIRAQEDIDEFLRAQDEVIEEIEHCKSYYKVPSMCYRYGRQCEFAQICDHYNPELEYVNYKIKEDHRNVDLP